MKDLPNKKIKKSESTIDSNDFAVISYLNQQYFVVAGQKFEIPLLSTATADEKIVFDKVLLTKNNVGEPYLPNHKVVGKIIKTLKKQKKIIVFKYKSKKNYRIKQGHRQKTTVVEIISLK